MILTIIIALCIWFVVPILLESHIKGKKNKKALAIFCRIVGAVILVWTIINAVISLF
jgi:hypothetical protein